MSSLISKLINLAGNITGTLGIANGGTGQVTANAGFAALSPMTTRGDMIRQDASAPGRFAVGTAFQYLRSDGTDPGWQYANSANLRGSEGAGTTTLTIADNPVQTFTLSAGRVCKLATTTIPAGYRYVIQNTGAFDLTIQSSDGTAMTAANVAAGSVGDPTINVGYVVLESTQATPTTPGHWRVAGVYENYSYTSTFTWDTAGGGTSASRTIFIMRNNKNILFTVQGVNATTGATSTTLTANTAIPVARLTPTKVISNCVILDQNAVAVGQVGVLMLNEAGAGKFSIRKSDSVVFAAAQPNSGTATFLDYMMITYDFSAT